jgi:hypothetical protein
LLSEAAYAVVATTPLAHEPRRIAKLEGKFSLPIGPGRSEVRLYELRSRGLEARRIGGVAGQLSDYTSSSLRSRIDWKERRAKRKGGGASAQASSRHDYDGSSEWKWEDEASGSENENEDESESEGGKVLEVREDLHFLGSGNLCRWIIDYDELRMGPQVRKAPIA